jgi:hypothetical protein
MKKWIIAAAIVVAVWLGAYSCSPKPKPVAVQPPVVTQVKPDPIRAVKPALKRTAPVKHVVKKPAPVPEKVYFLGNKDWPLN